MNPFKLLFYKLFKEIVIGKGYYEEYDGIKHWVPAPVYLKWRWT